MPGAEKIFHVGKPSKAAVLQRMERHRLVAVVRSQSAEDAYAIASAAADGGIVFVEVTLTVPDALGVIEKLAPRSDLFIGAGTVLSQQAATEAIASGAQFIVSPTVELGLIPLCQEAGIPCFPGAATPTEIVTASRAGADLIKIFPADLLGGVDFIRQLRGPFPDLRFMVSGGVNKDNAEDYAQAGVIGICLGSALLNDLRIRHGTNGLTEEVKEWVRLVAGKA